MEDYLSEMKIMPFPGRKGPALLLEELAPSFRYQEESFHVTFLYAVFYHLQEVCYIRDLLKKTAPTFNI